MKVALITGGSRGIGQAMVREFAGSCYSVAFTYAQNREAADGLVGVLAEQA
jgi:3-oxoacyl-[acyl-carrier protein] reductase